MGEVLAKSMQEMMEDPTLKAQAERLAKEMEVMEHDPELQKQARRLTEQMEAMMADPKVQEQAKLFAEQMEAGFGGLDLKDRVVELEDGPLKKSAMVDRLVNHLADNLLDQ